MQQMTQETKKFFGLNGAEIKELLRFALIAIIIILPIRYFVMQPFLVSGLSMDPTFKNRDYLIVDKLSYRLHEPKRGDVIVFKFPNEKRRFLVKRLIGLPGDTVTLKPNGEIIVQNTDYPNGFTVSEDYVFYKDLDSYSITVPNEKVLVLGDNRPVSYDSRAWGLLDEHRIVGRAYLRLWPLGSIDYLPGKTDLLNK